jgi:transposase
MNSLPEADWLLADRGYDADWFRETLVGKGTTPCTPVASRAKKPSSTTSAATNAATASRECSADSRIGDAILTRYDRSPTVFLSAIALAAAVIFWL